MDRAIVTLAEEMSFWKALLTTVASWAPQPLSATAPNATASILIMGFQYPGNTPAS